MSNQALQRQRKPHALSEKTQLRQPQSLHTLNEPWQNHKEANENQWEEKETPSEIVNLEMKWMKPMKAHETTSSTKMEKRMRKPSRELESNNEGGKV